MQSAFPTHVHLLQALNDLCSITTLRSRPIGIQWSGLIDIRHGRFVGLIYRCKGEFPVRLSRVSMTEVGTIGASATKRHIYGGHCVVVDC